MDDFQDIAVSFRNCMRHPSFIAVIQQSGELLKTIRNTFDKNLPDQEKPSWTDFVFSKSIFKWVEEVDIILKTQCNYPPGPANNQFHLTVYVSQDPPHRLYGYYGL